MAVRHPQLRRLLPIAWGGSGAPPRLRACTGAAARTHLASAKQAYTRLLTAGLFIVLLMCHPCCHSSRSTPSTTCTQCPGVYTRALAEAALGSDRPSASSREKFCRTRDPPACTIGCQFELLSSSNSIRCMCLCELLSCRLDQLGAHRAGAFLSTARQVATVPSTDTMEASAIAGTCAAGCSCEG